jgi:biotin carboxyl carrier protein
MTKNYKVYVNGKAYEVQIEELGPQPVTQQYASPLSVPQKSEPAPVQKQPVPEKTAVAKTPEKESTTAPTSNKPSAGRGKEFIAPMSGLVIDVFVKNGQKVKFGDTLLKIEAMKMENDIICDIDGVVEEVNVQKGENVETGKTMVSIVKL